MAVVANPEPTPAWQLPASTINCPVALAEFSSLRTLGIVRGVTVRTKNIVAGFGAGVKSVVGGEIKTFTGLCDQARKEALLRMLEQAAERGADGVVGVRYDTNAIGNGVTEVLAYGMAVSTNGATESADELEKVPGGAIPRGWVCTSNEIPGHATHYSLGVVQGLTVRTRNVFASIGAGLKSIVGGEIRAYTKLCEDARQEAYVRMITEAVQRGADGIVGVRYGTSEIVDGVTEVLAFGTAVSSTVGNLVTPEIAELNDGSLTSHMVTTSNHLHGFTMQCSLGIASGVTVRSSNILANIGAGIKTLSIGGEIKTWTKMCKHTRAQAFQRMLQHAQQMGAKGVVAMRYVTNQISAGKVEVTAYGTAVCDVLPVVGVPTTPSSKAFFGQQFISTNVEIPGHHSQCSLGIVRGISVQSVNIIRDIGAALKSVVGGEICNYTVMSERAHEEALNMMLQQAAQMGATGIVGFRYDCNDLVSGTIEVVAYGTAVSCASVPASTSGALTDQDLLPPASVTTCNKLVGSDMRQPLGVVRGITVRSRNIFANLGAGFKSTFVGGEIDTWRNVCEAARADAYKRMLEEAIEVGAKGVVAMRYETNELSNGIAEVLAYGTAVA